ncbi:KLHL9 protein, partial [Amia calva]|nr:KLHL9 protein [Amia calva]
MWVADHECADWRRLGELRNPVYNHCAAVLGSFLFILGGQHRFDPAGNQPTNEVFRYDPRDGSWLQVAGMLEKRTRFHADVLGGQLVAVAGGTLLGKLTDTVEEYRPTENRWEYSAPYPLPVADHAGATHKGILYIAGKQTHTDRRTHTDTLTHAVTHTQVVQCMCWFADSTTQNHTTLLYYSKQTLYSRCTQTQCVMLYSAKST